jgi:nitrate reductase cytochrome c-type subunit
MEKHMKRFTTIVFAALVALTLSMPVWAQNNPPAGNSQTKTTEKPTKAEKKKKQDKKAKKANKDSKNNSTNNPSTK